MKDKDFWKEEERKINLSRLNDLTEALARVKELEAENKDLKEQLETAELEKERLEQENESLANTTTKIERKRL